MMVVLTLVNYETMTLRGLKLYHIHTANGFDSLRPIRRSNGENLFSWFAVPISFECNKNKLLNEFFHL